VLCALSFLSSNHSNFDSTLGISLSARRSSGTAHKSLPCTRLRISSEHLSKRISFVLVPLSEGTCPHHAYILRSLVLCYYLLVDLFPFRFGVLNPISAAEEVIIAPRVRGHEWTFTCKSAFPTIILDGVLLTSGRWCDLCSHSLLSLAFVY